MKKGSAPSFRAPGGHIFDVVAQVLKKHVFTAMLAQHVALLTGNLLLLGNQQLTIRTQCTKLMNT